jgi:hypothetical protein
MADVIIGKTSSGVKLPVNVDNNGRIVISGTVSSIGNVETILNTQTAIETAMAADTALIKASSASILGKLGSTTATKSTFTSVTSAQILAANSSRSGVLLSSPSSNTGACYVSIGSGTTSSTSFSFIVNPGDTVNVTGINTALTGLWSATGNTLYVTEIS